MQGVNAESNREVVNLKQHRKLLDSDQELVCWGAFMEVGECKSVHIMQCNTQSSSNAWGKKQAGQQGGNEGQETRVKFGEELIAAR